MDNGDRIDRKPRGLSILAAGAALFFVSACAAAQAAPPATPAVAPTNTMPTATPIATAKPVAVALAPEQAAPAAELLTYNGEIAATSQVNIVAEVGGEVLEVLVEVGDRVRAGDLLVRIDSATLEAQRAQALAGLEAAQAQLDLLTTPATEEDLAAASAGLAAASAAYQKAKAGPTEEDLRFAEAQLRQAQAAVTSAQAAYNQVKGNQNIATLPQTLQLQQAKLRVEAAQAQYDKIVLGATADVIASRYAQVAQARAQLQRLEDGADATQIDAAQAQVERAEAALYLAQLQISKATVRAPVDGIVARRTTTPGATAAPGSPLLLLYSTAVEVQIPVEEYRLSALAVGQAANIRVAAYPDRVYAGEIAIIAPQLNSATRTVNVTIRPTDDSTGLAPGMFATVEIKNPS